MPRKRTLRKTIDDLTLQLGEANAKIVAVETERDDLAAKLAEATKPKPARVRKAAPAAPVAATKKAATPRKKT